MKEIIKILVIIGFIAFVSSSVANAQGATSTIDSLLTQIQTLTQQVESLKVRIAEMNGLKAQVKSDTKQIKETLRIMNQLRRGMTGDEVKTLQEILATDSSIYPGGLITGYYGYLTEKAVKKFQEKLGLNQVGNVGPKTLEKINEILAEGAGNSGKVPPGLLIAPGIKKKLGGAAAADITPPVISDVTATSVTSTYAGIIWKTNEQSTSSIRYSTSSPVAGNNSVYLFNNELVKDHFMPLVNLTASTTYYYVVGSADIAGNPATSSEKSFTTSP